jgi:hypothetical protein
LQGEPFKVDVPVYTVGAPEGQPITIDVVSEGSTSKLTLTAGSGSRALIQARVGAGFQASISAVPFDYSCKLVGGTGIVSDTVSTSVKIECVKLLSVLIPPAVSPDVNGVVPLPPAELLPLAPDHGFVQVGIIGVPDGTEISLNQTFSDGGSGRVTFLHHRNSGAVSAGLLAVVTPSLSQPTSQVVRAKSLTGRVCLAQQVPMGQ